MEKLTKENIQFIENYLKNSDVEYLDVRVEMTDHIASEIEAKMEEGDARGFYEIFKSYMLEHKTTLLKSLKKFRKQADKKMLRLVFRNSYHPKTLGLGALIITLFFLMKDFVMEHSSAFLLGFYGLLLGICLLPFLILKKNRFSTLQRLLFWFGLVGYLLLVQFQQSFLLNEPMGLIGFVLLIWTYVAVIKTLFDQVVYYRKKFLA
ncbi:MAG TPA: hypothetical protein VFM65_04820 [Flavobacteriaceae bacterium]|nr:hypothetical protein [Flavobacteriaceae bacterium]